MAERRSHRPPKPVYNAEQIVKDMANQGLDVKGLAARAGCSHMRVRRFLDGSVQTPATHRLIALALGFSPRRYVSGVRAAAEEAV
mgnify:CR=1 FL=1